jgi:hypothetical protein
MVRSRLGRSGFCRVETGSEDEWRHCRVVDASALDLEIDVEAPGPSRLVGLHITVELSPFDGPVRVRLEGQIQEAFGTGYGDMVRIGIASSHPLEPELYMAGGLTATSAVPSTI